MGNFSKDPKIVLQEALEKGYSSVRFQQGKPLLDRELNLLGDLANPQRLAEHHLGNGVPADSNGFLISGLDVANDDFTIGAGRCLVGGYEIALALNTTYKTQPHTENVSSLPEVGNVYLRVFKSEATGVQDSDLNNSGAGDVGFETAVREKTEWEVLVTTSVINTHDHFLLAEINTVTPVVVDRRRAGLTVAAIRDEIALSRGSASQLNNRLDISLSPDGTLKADSVGNSQIANNAVDTNKIADNAVTAVKLQSHSSDNAQRAVGKQHIQNGAVSIAQLNATLILDSEVSVPAAPAVGQIAEQAVLLQQVDEHAFFLISVRYVGPRPVLPPLQPYSSLFTWTRRNLLFKPPLPIPLLHRHLLVIQNPNTFAITVSCKAYRLFET